MALIKIMDYRRNKRDVPVDLENVGRIDVEVISGDEVLTVTKKDYTVERYDSSDRRFIDYYDYQYTIYDPEDGINMLEDPVWKNRKSSYSIMYKALEDEDAGDEEEL